MNLYKWEVNWRPCHPSLISSVHPCFIVPQLVWMLMSACLMFISDNTVWMTVNGIILTMNWLRHCVVPSTDY